MKYAPEGHAARGRPQTGRCAAVLAVVVELVLQEFPGDHLPSSTSFPWVECLHKGPQTPYEIDAELARHVDLVPNGGTVASRTSSKPEPQCRPSRPSGCTSSIGAGREATGAISSSSGVIAKYCAPAASGGGGGQNPGA